MKSVMGRAEQSRPASHGIAFEADTAERRHRHSCRKRTLLVYMYTGVRARTTLRPNHLRRPSRARVLPSSSLQTSGAGAGLIHAHASTNAPLGHPEIRPGREGPESPGCR